MLARLPGERLGPNSRTRARSGTSAPRSRKVSWWLAPRRRSAREGQVRDPARGDLRRHGVAVLDAAQVVPQPDAAAEQDRDDGYVEPFDEALLEELADHRRASADPHVRAAG